MGQTYGTYFWGFQNEYITTWPAGSTDMKSSILTEDAVADSQNSINEDLRRQCSSVIKHFVCRRHAFSSWVYIRITVLQCDRVTDHHSIFLTYCGRKKKTGRYGLILLSVGLSTVLIKVWNWLLITLNGCSLLYVLMLGNVGLDQEIFNKIQN